jgi:predicted O-methyltransferase YrrM
MEIIQAVAGKYSEAYSSPLNGLAKEVYNDTCAYHPGAHMISGQVQGSLLQTISMIMQPRYILEIGTFTGFSGLCLAAGLHPEGVLHTIECRSDDAAKAQHYFNRSSFSDRIKLHVGDARQIIPEIPHIWDLVFIDADKTSYITYYELVLPRLSTRGLIIADNVLFHGQVLVENIKGKNAIAINDFNKHVQADSRTEQVILTVRDGLMFIRKC